MRKKLAVIGILLLALLGAIKSQKAKLTGQLDKKPNVLFLAIDDLNDWTGMLKGNIHEGGIRVPMIVVWDKKVAANTVSDALVQSIDFYPTFLELTGTTPNSNQVLDGVSLANFWLKNKPLNRDAIYSHFPHYTPVTGNVPSTAVWYKHYKMVKEYSQAENFSDAYKLYDLKKDIGETTDISEKHPKLSKKLAEMIENHLKDIDAMVPIKNPAYDPKAKSKLGITHDFPIHKYLSY